MQAPQNTFLTTRLYVPPARLDLVARPRLIEKINKGLTRKLTLITAPVGFGKTTLLTEWISQCDLAATWISLHPDINDPAQFLEYLLAALEILQPGFCLSVQSSLHSAFPSLLSQSTLAALLNVVATIPRDFVLVLDDYHWIDDQYIHHAMDFFIEHLPPQMHIVIASRVHPPLCLVSLRGKGQIAEIRARDLCFTLAETTLLNQVMHLELSSEDIELLEERTEGWIAGLHFAVLAMQEQADSSIFLKSLRGRNHYILDYLFEEVFKRQPQQVQTFLLHTSILGHLTASLCDAVTGRNDSQDLLEGLERTNLFIVALDDERYWYRYHSLFVDVLSYLLSQQSLFLLPELHKRASEWYEKNAMLKEAVEHAIAAADFTRATALAEQTADGMWMQGELPMLLEWLKALPEDLVFSRPRLCTFYAWVLYVVGQVDSAVSYLQIAERKLSAENDNTITDISLALTDAFEQNPLSEYPVFQAMLLVVRTSHAIMLGDGARTIELAPLVLKYRSKETALWSSVITLGLGFAYQAKGDIIAASRNMGEASRVSQISGNTYTRLFAMSTHAQLQVEQGHLARADRTFRLVIQDATRAGEHLSTIAGWGYVGLSEVCREWNSLEEAVNCAQEGLKCGELAGNESIVANGYTALARLKMAQGNMDAALDYIQQAEQLARACKVPLIASHAAATQARLWIARGNLDVAIHWAKEAQLDTEDELSYAHEFEHITLARVLLAQGKYQTALPFLHRLLLAARAGGRMRRVIEILLLKAIGYAQKKNDTSRAILPLKQALLLAQGEGHLRVFLDEGRPLASLLSVFHTLQAHQYPSSSQQVQQAYIEKLLALLRKDFEPVPEDIPMGKQALVEPLSKRELEILRLIGAGMSNREIAVKMVVTVGTVKWHVNNIFGKLSVHSRTQALARAKGLYLLP